MKDLSLYIHIPFCESKCSYCNFVSSRQSEKTISQYFLMLNNEIENSIYKKEDYCIKTIYIGGGTPSFVNEKYIVELLNKIYACFYVDKNAEISIECNPNSLSFQKAKAYNECGINRVSVGLQVANNKLLKQLNRPHNVKDFVNAVKILRNAQFKNISADILLGVPNQKMKDIKRALKLFKKFNIEHISAYGLILENKTKLCQQVNTHQLKLPSEKLSLKMYDYVYKYLYKDNIERYEVSNFAKKGKECLHNIVYWNGKDYLGFGISAHSKIGSKRFCNTEILNEYLNGITIKEAHNLTLQEQMEEAIMLSLRTQKGINILEFNSKFNCDFLTQKQKQIEKLLQYKLININFLGKNDIYLSASLSGFSVLNAIIIELI